MNPIIPGLNKEIFTVINHLDPDPKKPRPVTFWFCSESEEKILRLAAHFQNNGYRITFCGRPAAGGFLCIAEIVISPGNALLDRLCVDMQILAEKMDVQFDGWETRV